MTRALELKSIQSDMSFYSALNNFPRKLFSVAGNAIGKHFHFCSRAHMNFYKTSDLTKLQSINAHSTDLFWLGGGCVYVCLR